MKRISSIYPVIILILLMFTYCDKMDEYFPGSGSDTEIKAGINNDNDNSSFVDYSPDSVLPDPDWYEPSGTMFIDIDEDGTNDLSLFWELFYGNSGSSTENFMINCLHSDCLIAITDSVNPAVYNNGDIISCDENFKTGEFNLIDKSTYSYWDDTTQELVNVDNSDGIWYDLDRKYIAFKFLSSGNWYLGWIKIGLINNNTSLVIYEYGYEMNPDC